MTSKRATDIFRHKASWSTIMLALVLLYLPWNAHADTVASLLGNFTINQFAGVRVDKRHVDVRFVVVMGQLPALKALHEADTNQDGVTSQAERDAYLKKLAPGFAQKLKLRANGRPVPLHLVSWTSSLPSESSGFSLRFDAHYASKLPAIAHGAVVHLRFANTNYSGRIGWHEIVVKPASGISIFNTNAVSTSMTKGLSVNPEKLPPGGPLNERAVHLVFTGGPAPAGAKLLHARKGYPAGASGTRTASNKRASKQKQGWLAWLGRDLVVGSTSMSNTAASGTAATWLTRSTKHLVDMISPRHEVSTGIALLALLIALVLGALHAFSPGHGKTVVGAYLVGSRGTPRHALFLGLTVTITHTAGVFALGFATLLASQYVMPEKIFPILSLISGLLVVAIGATLLINRFRAWRGHGDTHQHTHGEPDHDHLPSGAPTPALAAAGAETGATLAVAMHSHQGDQHTHHGHAAGHQHHHGHSHDHGHQHGHSHEHPHSHEDGHAHGHGHTHEHTDADGRLWHSHGGKMHSHSPPGAAGERISWKSLLALGVSGGLIPCPSAMVLLLAAIAAHKTAYGMVLVLAFSIGLAVTLTAVGMVFLYARGLFRRRSIIGGRLVQILPIISAGLITGVGLIMCYGVLATTGIGI